MLIYNGREWGCKVVCRLSTWGVRVLIFLPKTGIDPSLWQVEIDQDAFNQNSDGRMWRTCCLELFKFINRISSVLAQQKFYFTNDTGSLHKRSGKSSAIFFVCIDRLKTDLMISEAFYFQNSFQNEELNIKLAAARLSYFYTEIF